VVMVEVVVSVVVSGTVRGQIAVLSSDREHHLCIAGFGEVPGPFFCGLRLFLLKMVGES
jgi:hypothetical protein